MDEVTPERAFFAVVAEMSTGIINCRAQRLHRPTLALVYSLIGTLGWLDKRFPNTATVAPTAR